MRPQPSVRSKNYALRSEIVSGFRRLIKCRCTLNVL